MRRRIHPADWSVLVAELSAVTVLFLTVAVALLATAGGDTGGATFFLLGAGVATAGLARLAYLHGRQRGRREMIEHRAAQAAHRERSHGEYGADLADRVDEVPVRASWGYDGHGRYGLGTAAADCFGEPRAGQTPAGRADFSAASAAAETPFELGGPPQRPAGEDRDVAELIIVEQALLSGTDGISKHALSGRLAELGQPVRNSTLIEVLDQLVADGKLVQRQRSYGRYRHPDHAGRC